MEGERGDHIVPSFEELFPGLRGDNSCDGTSRKKHIGVDYYQVEKHNSQALNLTCYIGCNKQSWPWSPSSAR